MESHETFPHSLESVRAARHWASDWSADNGAVTQADALALIVSELVTTAVENGEGLVEVALELRYGRVHGGVRDLTGMPLRLDADEGREAWLPRLLAEFTLCWAGGNAEWPGGVRFEIAARRV